MKAEAERAGRLHAILAGYPGLAIAYSGGVDSSVLAHAAQRALGGRAVAVIADSPSLPREELRLARAQAAAIGIELVVVATDELSDPDYRRNAGDRCYFCKQALFDAMAEVAQARGIRHLAFGEIVDDRALLRHGSRAAAKFGVVAPLADAGFDKQAVREYARARGLASAEKPASACLASRVPVGTPVSRERLERIERAERALAPFCFDVLRVRDHWPRARVEVDEARVEGARVVARDIAASLEPLGYVEVEIAAYRAPAPGA